MDSSTEVTPLENVTPICIEYFCMYRPQRAFDDERAQASAAASSVNRHTICHTPLSVGDPVTEPPRQPGDRCAALTSPLAPTEKSDRRPGVTLCEVVSRTGGFGLLGLTLLGLKPLPPPTDS